MIKRISAASPLLWKLPAGIVDAGLASLAALIAGLYAAKYLSAADLGGYALFFRALLVSAVFSRELIFVPSEVRAIREPLGTRLGVLPSSMSAGLIVSLMAASFIVVAVIVAPADLNPAAVRVFALTAGAAAILSPIQDHLRRMQHIDGRSWGSAAMSLALFSTVLLIVVAAVLLGKRTAWIPFGSLALANAVSIGIGLLANAGTIRDAIAVRIRLRELLQTGRWLVVAGLAPVLAGFVAATLVGRLVSSEALGFAEAARILGQPILVMAFGLNAVLGPRSVRAGQQRNKAAAKRIARAYGTLLGTAGLVYGILVAVPWSWSPIDDILPNAFVVSGLVAVTVLANVINSFSHPGRAALIGAGEERGLAGLEIVVNAVRIAVAGTARLTGAFAIPLSFLALGAARIVGLGWPIRRVFSGEGGSSAAGTSDPDRGDVPDEGPPHEMVQS